MSEDYEPINPVMLESEIRKSDESIAKSIVPVSKAYDAWKSAELQLDKAYALAYRDADGSVEDRKQAAFLATIDLAWAAKDADVVYRRMRDYQRAYRDRLSAFQSLSKSVVAAYNVAGRP